MATKCCPSGISEKKCANSDSGSIVPPDLEETMNSVRAGSTAAVTARTLAASVESSTCRRGPSPCPAKERRSTSGASEEPPMPSSTASVKPSLRTSAAKASRSPSSARMRSAIVSQPSRFATSGVPGGPHSVGSPARTPRGHLLALGERDPLLDRRAQGSRYARLERRDRAGHATIVVASSLV